MQEIMNQRGIIRFLLLFVIVGIILLPIAGQASDTDKKTVRVGSGSVWKAQRYRLRIPA